MKVEITYNEIQYFTKVVEVEMTKKQYKKYMQMTKFELEREFDLMSATTVENWVGNEIDGVHLEIIN
jgi:hypothetical protein